MGKTSSHWTMNISKIIMSLYPRMKKEPIQKWTELSEKEMRTARKSARREFWLEWKFHFQQKWSSNINYNFRCLQKYYLIYFIYFTFIFNEFIYVKLYFPRGGRKWSILAVQSELKPFSYPFLKKLHFDYLGFSIHPPPPQKKKNQNLFLSPQKSPTDNLVVRRSPFLLFFSWSQISRRCSLSPF